VSANEGLNCLLGEVDKLVDRFKAESARYKRVAATLRMISVFLAALITVLLGLRLGHLRQP
jgi:hypothetical protein